MARSLPKSLRRNLCHGSAISAMVLSLVVSSPDSWAEGGGTLGRAMGAYAQCSAALIDAAGCSPQVAPQLAKSSRLAHGQVRKCRQLVSNRLILCDRAVC